MLAVQGLIDVAKIKDGQKLLINGAGGGTGTFALQLARLHGREVTAVVAPKTRHAEVNGSGTCYRLQKEDFTRSKIRYDLIFDVKTNRSILEYLRVLTPEGMYVTVGGSMSRLFQALLLMPWIPISGKKKVRVVALKTNKHLVYMGELFEAGKVKPVIDTRSYTLAEVPEAMRLFGSAGHKGKIVIKVA